MGVHNNTKQIHDALQEQKITKSKEIYAFPINGPTQYNQGVEYCYVIFYDLIYERHW